MIDQIDVHAYIQYTCCVCKKDFYLNCFQACNHNDAQKKYIHISFKEDQFCPNKNCQRLKTLL